MGLADVRAYMHFSNITKLAIYLAYIRPFSSDLALFGRVGLGWLELHRCFQFVMYQLCVMPCAGSIWQCGFSRMSFGECVAPGTWCVGIKEWKMRYCQAL